MNKEERKTVVMNVAMKQVVEKGFFGFSVKDVADLAKFQSVVIYRDFGTRENLLLESYRYVEKEMNAFLESMSIPPLSDPQELMSLIQYFWYNYFQMLLRQKEKTLYYSFYRNAYLTGKDDVSSDDEGIVKFKEMAIKVFGIDDDQKLKMMKYHIQDMSLNYAVKILLGQIADTPAVYEDVKRLIFTGLNSLS